MLDLFDPVDIDPDTSAELLELTRKLDAGNIRGLSKLRCCWVVPPANC